MVMPACSIGWLNAAVIVSVESLGSETICLSGITLPKWAFAKVQTDKRANARIVLLMKPSINKNNGTRYFFILRRKKLHAHESLFLRPNSENDVFLVSPPSR